MTSSPKYFRLFLIILLAHCHFFAAGYSGADSLKRLLLDTDVKIEATQAVNDMYNFKFDRAEMQFRWLKQKYGWHPLPDFLMGLSHWWKIVPNMDVEKYDEEFFTYMDSAIYKADRIMEREPENPEAAFFLAAAYGFKARLHSERRNWTKAASAGKNALDYMDLVKGNKNYSPELLFGDALYNYYSVWVPDNYPLLKPIIMFFPKGDKELGIRQLKKVANNAFYTRTEAQYFLMRILSGEHKDMEAALHVSSYLAETFPDNSYFQRYYARLLYTMGRYSKAKEVSWEILAKIDSGYTGYGGVSGRYASFFLGQIHEFSGSIDSAKYYYERSVDFSKDVNDTDKGYFHYSLLNLGNIAHKEGKSDLAKDYYKQVKDYADRGDAVHKKARTNLREERDWWLW